LCQCRCLSNTPFNITFIAMKLHQCCVHMTQILFVSRSSFKYWSNKTVYTSSQRKFCNKNIKNQIIPKTFLQRFLKVGRIHWLLKKN
jgi:hypothetical protein